MAGTNSLKRFLKKKLLVQRNTKINKNQMASLSCQGDSDCNRTQIIRNCHLYVIQLWKPFFHIFTLGDVINAQTREVSPQKNPVEPP